jgi:FkbM family methyltransferase
MAIDLRTFVHQKLWSRPRVWRLVATAAHPSNRGRRAAAIGRAIRYDVMTETLGRPTLLPIGKKSQVIAYPGEIDPIFSLVRNPPDWPDMLVWDRYLRPGDLFIDVGANIGLYTLYVAEMGVEVIAVEPNGHSAARVQENLDHNGLRAEIVQKALAEKPGVVRMTDDLDVLNHIVEGDAGVEVEATTLDELLGDRTAAVKIDVEGAEERVLAGAVRALEEKRISLLQLEWILADHMAINNRAALYETLDKAGYDLFIADRFGGLVPFEDPTASQMNVFAKPRD